MGTATTLNVKIGLIRTGLEIFMNMESLTKRKSDNTCYAVYSS